MLNLAFERIQLLTSLTQSGTRVADLRISAAAPEVFAGNRVTDASGSDQPTTPERKHGDHIHGDRPAPRRPRSRHHRVPARPTPPTRSACVIADLEKALTSDRQPWSQPAKRPITSGVVEAILGRRLRPRRHCRALGWTSNLDLDRRAARPRRYDCPTNVVVQSPSLAFISRSIGWPSSVPLTVSFVDAPKMLGD